jgi:DNA-binding beta-propeller fold protein YncE
MPHIRNSNSLAPIAVLLSTALAPCQAPNPHAPLERYGAPTASTVSGAPLLWTNGVAHLGDPGFAFTHRCLAPNSFVLTAVAPAPSVLTISGLWVNVDPLSAVLLPPQLTSPTGTAATGLPVPLQPSLAGLQLYAQGFALDANSVSPLQLTGSAGLRVRLRQEGQLLVGADVFVTPPNPGNDPLFAIDLLSGAAATVSTTGNALYHTAHSKDGRRAFVLDRIGGNLLVLDTTVSPPVQILSRPLQQRITNPNIQPTVLRVTPDGSRLLVGVAGPAPMPVQVEVFDADPASATFAQYLTAIPVAVSWVSDLRIASHGQTAYVYAAILPGSDPVRPWFAEIDLTAGPAFGTTLRTLEPRRGWTSPTSGLPATTHGRLMAIAPDDRYAYIGLWGVVSAPSEVAIVDLVTMLQVDCIPATPELDNLSMSINGAVPGGLDMDLLGEELWFGERAGANSLVTAIQADPLSPSFGARRSVAVPLSPDFLVVSPAGERVWIIDNGSSTSSPPMLPTLREIDTATLAVTRTWSFPVYRLHWPSMR